MDDLLRKYKKLFITVFVILAVLAIWHGTYVARAVTATGDSFLMRDYSMLALGLIMLALLTGIVLLCLKKYRTTTVWLFVFVLLAVSCMRVLPGLSAPDESSHYVSAYYLSNQIMFREADNEAGRVWIREADLALEDVNGELEEYLQGDAEMTEILGQNPGEKTYHDIKNWNQEHPMTDGTTVSNRTRVETTPLVYLPQAIGITIARLLHLDSLTLITLGRLFNLLAFVILVYLAICRMPFGKNLMMASTLLPMTIHLAASMSYDAMLIACTYLFIAEVLRLAYAAEPVAWKDCILPPVLLAVLSPCKLVYAVLVLLVLLIPKEKLGKKFVPFLLICIAAAVLPMLLINLKVIGNYAAATGNDLIWAGEEGFTISYCLHHPLETIRLVYDSFVTQGSYYHLTMLGSYLGNANPLLDVPYFVLMIFTAILVILGLSEQDMLQKRGKWIAAGTGVLLLGLLMLSMLVGWTPMSSPVILGVQGRYFLPLLPLLLMLLPNPVVTVQKDISGLLLFVMVACDAYAFFRMYSMICLNV